MQALNGTYYCKMDAKGRIMLPAELRKQFADMQMENFVLKRAIFHNRLEMYPVKIWDKILGKLSKLSRFKKKNVDFTTYFLAGARNVSVDSTGRMQVPKDLVNLAELKKEIVLAANINTLQVWSKEAYDAFLKEVSLEDFSDLAEEVMGDVDIDFEEDDE